MSNVEKHEYSVHVPGIQRSYCHRRPRPRHGGVQQESQVGARIPAAFANSRYQDPVGSQERGDQPRKFRGMGRRPGDDDIHPSWGGGPIFQPLVNDRDPLQSQTADYFTQEVRLAPPALNQRHRRVGKHHFQRYARYPSARTKIQDGPVRHHRDRTPHKECRNQVFRAQVVPVVWCDQVDLGCPEVEQFRELSQCAPLPRIQVPTQCRDGILHPGEVLRQLGRDGCHQINQELRSKSRECSTWNEPPDPVPGASGVPRGTRASFADAELREYSVQDVLPDILAQHCPECEEPFLKLCGGTLWGRI